MKDRAQRFGLALDRMVPVLKQKMLVFGKIVVGVDNFHRQSEMYPKNNARHFGGRQSN
jgi:hypothetical protein